MQLAFITYEFPPDTGKGGIGTYTSQLARLLAAQGVDVHVFCGSTNPEKLLLDGYTVHKVCSANGNEFKKNVVEVFDAVHKEVAFDIIESAEINSNAFFIKKKFPAIPLVVRLHAPDYLVESYKKTYYPFFVKLRYSLGALKRGKLDAGYWRKYDFKTDPDYIFCKMADQLTTPSYAMQQWVKHNWHISKERIEVIPNPFFPSKQLLELPIIRNSGKKEIFFFGRLNVLKGLVNATHAVKKILQEFPQWHFKVVGDNGPGPYPGIGMKEWMKQQLSPFLSRVQFKDGYSYEELPVLIKDAEIVLLPSLFESFSYTCAETMAAGKPVVGSAGTGMEFIRNDLTGMLTNSSNYRDIYTALKKLILEEDLRYNLAVNAREAVQRLFAEAGLANLYLNSYKKTIEKNSVISFS